MAEEKQQYGHWQSSVSYMFSLNTRHWVSPFALKAIVFMERATENSIRETEFLEAFPFLLQQIHRPEDKGKMRNTLKLLQNLHKRVKFFRFYCNNYKEDCFEVAYNGLIESLKNP